MTTTETRVTKRECLETLIKLISITNVEFENPAMTNETLIDFCEHEIELLNKKAQSAAERAAERRAAGDALRAQIIDLLPEAGGEPMTIAEIVAAIGDEDVSPSMVTARLTQAKKADPALVLAFDTKGTNNRTIKAYTKA